MKPGTCFDTSGHTENGSRMTTLTENSPRSFGRIVVANVTTVSPCVSTAFTWTGWSETTVCTVSWPAIFDASVDALVGRGRDKDHTAEAGIAPPRIVTLTRKTSGNPASLTTTNFCCELLLLCASAE